MTTSNEMSIQTLARLICDKQLCMLSPARLCHTAQCVENALQENIPGALVECGVCKGGTLGLISWINNQHERPRNVWGFDTFAGLPKPTVEDGKGKQSRGGPKDMAATPDDVRETFSLIGAGPAILVKGLVQRTLPNVREKIGPIAVLRLDCDLYTSTKTCLENLYDQVSPGGWIIIDDYRNWEGCKRAVDEFRAARGMSPLLDDPATMPEAFWRKELKNDT